jgi:hypothetical protein
MTGGLHCHISKYHPRNLFEMVREVFCLSGMVLKFERIFQVQRQLEGRESDFTLLCM